METPYTVCSVVLAHVLDALNRSGRGVAVATVAVGGIVVDSCCEGLLAVAPERAYRTVDPWPQEQIFEGTVCEDAPIALDVIVALFRCMPVVASNGKDAPPAEETAAAAAEILHDAAIVWGAVMDVALLGDDPYDPGEPLWKRARVSQTFQPGEGGCVGIETRLTLGVGQSGWCL